MSTLWRSLFSRRRAARNGKNTFNPDEMEKPDMKRSDSVRSVDTVDSLADVDLPEGATFRAHRWSHSKERWVKTSNGSGEITEILPSSMALVTWNVDFAGEYAGERLQSILHYIQEDVFRCKDSSDQPPPCCILLQEIRASVLPVLLSDPWIREHFLIAPTSNAKWPRRSIYGNVTLVTRTIVVTRVWSVPFANSNMNRNSLMVDVRLKVPTVENGGGSRKGKNKGKAKTAVWASTIRVANTHLESLPGHGTRVRPEQLAIVARALQEDSVDGGIVCGDMNAIEASDWRIPSALGLGDAYGGEEDAPEGHTWGYQPPCEFQPGRLDKVLFYPQQTNRFVVDEPQRIGVGLAYGDMYASDHYGLLSAVHILPD